MPGKDVDLQETCAVQQRSLVANRNNALLSTGPKTPDGKAIVAQNARKHGILSQMVILPGENRDAFESFRESLYAQLEPSGELERVLADRVVAQVWRLRRILKVEVELFKESRRRQGHDNVGKAFIWGTINGDQFLKLARYEGAIERGMVKALHELERRQAERMGRPVPPPLLLDVTVTGETQS